MNSRLEAQSRQLSQNSNLTCSNSTQVQETAKKMRRSSLALRVITSSCAWRPEQHLGQAHGSVQLVVVVCKHRTLGGLAGTVLSALPHPPSPQCCHSSSSSWERPSCKRTNEGSHQPHNQLFLPQLVQVEDAQREKVPHHKQNVPRSSTPKSQIAQTVVLSSSKRAAHLDSSSSAVLSHEAAERPLSLVLFLSRLSRNRKTKLWRALLLSGRLTPTLQRLRKTTCSSPTFKTYQSRHVLPSTIAEAKKLSFWLWYYFTRVGLRSSSTIAPQLRGKCAAVQEIEIYTDAAGAVQHYSQQPHMLG